MDKLPEGADYTMTVGLNTKGDKAVFHLKELTEDIYIAARSFMDANKDFEAAIFIIKNLRVGGDEIGKIEGNFRAKQAARAAVAQFLTPLEYEVKKN